MGDMTQALINLSERLCSEIKYYETHPCFPADWVLATIKAYRNAAKMVEEECARILASREVK